MDKFLMICYVAADFVGPGRELYRVTAKDLGVFVEAPAWIRDTLLYKWLVNDGSIKVAADKPEAKKLENDPADGITAEGKAEPVEVNVTVRKTRKKKDDAGDA